MNRNTSSLWNGFRILCLVGGLILAGVAYVAPEWLAQHVSVDVVWGIALTLLLLLPVTMVGRFGLSRIASNMREAGRRADMEDARSRLPSWAQQHQLAFEPGTKHDEVGAVRGRHRGFLLLVDPDAGDISARFPGEAACEPIDISTTEPPASHHDALTSFDTGDERFDAIFPTRFATEAAAGVFSDNAAIRDKLVDFWKTHDDALQVVSIDEHGVVCFLEADSQYDVDTLVAVVDDLGGVMETLSQEISRREIN